MTRDPIRDDERPESKVYFRKCDGCCEFVSEVFGTREECDDSAPDECPKCGADLILKFEWV